MPYQTGKFPHDRICNILGSMINNEIYHVAVMPPAGASAGLLSQVAAIVAQPDYQIRLQLAGRLPKIIGHFKDESVANTAAHTLKELKLAAFVIAESDLRHRVSSEIITCSITFEGDSAIFISQDGKTIILKASDIFMIMTGRRTTVLQKASVERSTMKVNVPATLLTGGIPIMKRVISKGRESEKTTQQFIRLYRKASDSPTVEIRQFDLDYSFLGDKMGPTATSNIIETVAELRRFFAWAYFDDSLMNGFIAETNSISGIDIGEQSCLLLVRYYQTVANESL